MLQIQCPQMNFVSLKAGSFSLPPPPGGAVLLLPPTQKDGKQRDLTAVFHKSHSVVTFVIFFLDSQKHPPQHTHTLAVKDFHHWNR